MKNKEVYAHDKQIEFLSCEDAKVSCVLGQRAAGKTGALAYRFFQRPSEMPGGRFFLGAGTFDQLFNNVIPNIFQILSSQFSIQLEEGIDYVIGVNPPEWFDKPVQKPEKYANIISWSNGSWTELITPRKLQTIRGASTDGGDIDEGLLWNWKLISQVILPTFRGNRRKFGGCDLHQTVAVYSSLPRKPEAMWLMSMEKKAQADPKTFAFFFFRWLDNVDVIGADYGERMSKTMDPIEKAIEIDGVLNITTGEEYYYNFDYKRHVYISSKGYINGTNRKEYNQFAPIDLSFDFASHFNCLWVIQPNGLEIRCIDTMFVKFKQKLNILVSDFCHRYQNHENKRVNLFGEPHGTNLREDNDPLFEQIQQQFIKKGWEAVIWVESYDKADRHKERYKDMNEVFEEDATRQWLPFIRINAETCEDAIIALQKCKVTIEYKKDKTDEKKPKDVPQEHAPHFTDALDYYRKQKFALSNTSTTGGSAGTM